MARLELNDPSLIKSQAYLNGAWVGEPQDPILNPADGTPITSVPALSEVEAEAAVSAAYQALQPWAGQLAAVRAAALRRWLEQIRQHRDDLAKILTAEQGKPLAEASWEIDYAASFVEFYAEEALRIAGEILPSHLPKSRVMVTKNPIGVCAAITPWNFPAAMITRKCAPALAAGCTVVLKPAPETPLSALALAELADRAGLPQGAMNVITGPAEPIGRAWCDDPRVRLLGFTGSTEVGKLLMRQASQTVKKVTLELGGNAPFIVFADADLEAAVEGAIAAKFRNTGQTCICANRLFVHDSIHDRFVERLAERVNELVVGDGLDPETQQGPLINTAALDKVQKLLADAVAGGARVLTGGKPHPLGGTYFQPTVLDRVAPTMAITQQEIFGPVAPVIRFSSEAEVITQANDTPYGLAAYFYGRDLGQAFRVADRLEYGMVGINSTALGSVAVPFGGVKQSGIGREGSHHGIDEYLELKYLLVGGL
ncbi:MAG: NAD-dependent succinate-semialdehyde dehydrogenase [Planctomycetaceae bacterium]|nr:MAG: NAD-dependent succinate-semialdehyde dehydrogenase [Planctomycetaceae bacterium]